VRGLIRLYCRQRGGGGKSIASDLVSIEWPYTQKNISGTKGLGRPAQSRDGLAAGEKKKRRTNRKKGNFELVVKWKSGKSATGKQRADEGDDEDSGGFIICSKTGGDVTG